MKRLLIALLATSALAVSAPAMAHPDHPGTVDEDNWSNGGATYGDFNAEYQHIWQGIQHGLSDGSYTRSQAQQYYSAMQQIRARADWMNQNGRWDPQDTQARLERLHESMHRAHDVGHAIQDSQQQDTHGEDDSWNNGGASYSDFNAEYQHIWQGIQHGLSDGSYTRREAQRFYRAMQQIRSRADWMERNGRYDPQDTQARLERLHEAMHAAHERGHDRLDRNANSDWNYRR